LRVALPEKILIIKLGALGDFIQALGPMAAIRAHHPDAHITILTTKPYETIARACGYVDDVLLDTRPKWHDVKGWMLLRKNLNVHHFTRVYDLQNNDRTEFYLRLFSPKPVWIGAGKGATIRNTSPARIQGKAFDGHVQTLALAGISNIKPDALGWAQGRNTFDGLSSPYVLIVPGSAPSHPEKRWPATYYTALCKKLLGGGVLPVLIGTKAEEETLAEIQGLANGVLNLCGQTQLFDLPSLARSAAGAIGNDTGPMHLIAPTGCKTIVLFSKNSNPKRHAPLGQNVVTLQRNDLNDLAVEEVWSAYCAQHAAP
jgi:ADP-heptose:LPS heptosyltransferase